MRERAFDVVTSWTTRQERDDTAKAVAGAADGLVTGLSGCLDAAAEHAIATLVVADDLREPGRVCISCCAPTTRGGRCRWCGERTQPVPDVVDELVARVLDEGGRVDTAVRRGGPVARLRHPVARTAAPSLSAG